MGKTHLQWWQRWHRWETPPRTWGRHVPPWISSVPIRNTPTHVGKTMSMLHWNVLTEKHPHARGEDNPLRVPADTGRETPPRTWGRPEVGTEFAEIGRNTPTHVGKTTLEWQFLPNGKKHPHARGEDSPTTSVGVYFAETPPRTWGRRHP